MAVTYFPFNSIVVDGVPDRPANAENLAAYLAGFFSNGVLMQTDTALKVEASSGMNVQIHAGMGNINGKTILADAAEIITLDTASASLARIDRVVFRLDEVNRLMEFDVLKGTPASSPVAPALTQGADVYELCLAEIRVPAGASTILANHITDTRADADLCGVASIAPHMQDLKHGGTGISAETKEELLSKLGVDDYIIEHGTSGIWTYKKWSSGDIIAETIDHRTWGNGTLLGNSNIYYASVKVDLPMSDVTWEKCETEKQYGNAGDVYGVINSGELEIWNTRSGAANLSEAKILLRLIGKEK